ncbi:hypothetical protein B0I35DRAFT_70113 [Stachybotrys elegans]|uniref:DUF7598 domain-containing protein n=1 Tax=Stachybotrys elegans TaxID=80388 RepID=A0A8K0WN19_9HYPO|nr:hypothetical protein B0I35DRAFT_70113 [Stachybotrys elegans]
MFGISRGAGMIVLQILRAATVIGLLAGAASCYILMLHLDQDRGWFVFEGASIFFLSLVCLGLIVTEFPIINTVRDFFRESLPMLGPDSGLGALSLCLCVIGCNLLSKLNQPAYDTRNLADAFRQLIMAAGILNLVFGLLNGICTWVWSNRKEGIMARSVRSNGSLAEASEKGTRSWNEIESIGSIRKEKRKSKFYGMFWKGNNDNEVNSSSPRPNISGPMHADNSYDDDLEARQSPIVPGVRRPDTALHPMMHTRSSSRYSEANMSRF